MFDNGGNEIYVGNTVGTGLQYIAGIQYVANGGKKKDKDSPTLLSQKCYN